MKLLDSLKLNPKEQKFIKRFFFISLALVIVAVITAWALQRFSIKQITLNKILQKQVETDIVTLYSGKTRDLLPIDIDAHKFAAHQYKDDLIPEKSIKHLLRILSIERNNRKIKLDLATAYLKAGMYHRAEETFKALVEEDITDSLKNPIISRYGLALFYSGKIDESVVQLKKSLTFFPSSAEAYCYLGQVDAALNMASEKAEGYFKKSLEIDPDYTEAWYQLARYYMNKPNANDTDYYNARICLKKQIQIEPLNPKAHSRLGMVYYYLEQPHLAEKFYQTALTLNWNDYNTHYNLGELYYSIFNTPKKALKEFNNTIQIKRNHVEANFKIGLISLENNMYKESIQYFKKASQSAPGNIRVLLQLGVAYEKIGMVPEALSVYKSILDLDALNDIALQKLKLLGCGK